MFSYHNITHYAMCNIIPFNGSEYIQMVSTTIYFNNKYKLN